MNAITRTTPHLRAHRDCRQLPGRRYFSARTAGRKVWKPPSRRARLDCVVKNALAVRLLRRRTAETAVPLWHEPSYKSERGTSILQTSVLAWKLGRG